jgi:hypothetical protein
MKLQPKIKNPMVSLNHHHIGSSSHKDLLLGVSLIHSSDVHPSEGSLVSFGHATAAPTESTQS